MHKSDTVFLSVDDKCKVPVGEPGFPVAAVSRGKKVNMTCKDPVFTTQGITNWMVTYCIATKNHSPEQLIALITSCVKGHSFQSNW